MLIYLKKNLVQRLGAHWGHPKPVLQQLTTMMTKILCFQRSFLPPAAPGHTHKHKFPWLIPSIFDGKLEKPKPFFHLRAEGLRPRS